MIKFIDEHPSCLNDTVEHIYLNSSINDIIIRICCVQDLEEDELEKLDNVRQEALSTIINKLEHNQDDDFMTQ